MTSSDHHNGSSERRLIDLARREALESQDQSTGNVCARGPLTPMLPPGSISGYRLLCELQRGGQGVVYRAVQESTGREVAVKVMREGPFAGPRDKARFEREVHILAQLNHPNIVAIHDSGEAAGSFYYVMDVVDGTTLDEYVRSLAPPEARAPLDRACLRNVLTLFAKVCDAVNIAHLRGIIHRDLKPANVRVDAAGEPRILDFGLAKISDQWSVVSGQNATNAHELAPADHRPLATGHFTETGQFVGSLPWASPEQIEGNPARIDVRSDVYSLGVTLYQLLTGHFPYDVHGPVRDVLERILRNEPAPPSSVNERTDDEIDTMVLKCLSKDADRRYQSAGELARDLRHYLAGEPIEAKRDSGWYVLKKTARRHRGAVTIAAVIALLVVASSVWLSLLHSQARQAQILAEERLAQMTSARAAESESRRAAEHEAEIARSIRVFLENMLAASVPDSAPGRELTVREVLDDAAVGIEHDLTAEPDVEAAVRLTVGAAYRALGQFQPAEQQFRTTLTRLEQRHGEHTIELVQPLRELAVVLVQRHQLDEAESLVRRMLAILERSDPDDAAQAAAATLLGMISHHRARYDEAEQFYRQALALRRRAALPDHDALASALGNLAAILLDRGNHAWAEPVLREALDLQRQLHGEEHSSVARTLANLAAVSVARGDLRGGAELTRQSLQIRRKLFGDDHPDLAMSIQNLAGMLCQLGDVDAAEPLAREALATRSRLLGDEHPDVAECLSTLAIILRSRGELAAAEETYSKALGILRKAHGEHHPAVAGILNNMGVLTGTRGDYAGAEALHRQALEIYRECHGNQHIDVAAALSRVAECRRAQGDLTQAEGLLGEALDIQRGLSDSSHELANTLTKLGKVQCEKGDFKAAERLYREALTMRQAIFGESHVDVARTMAALAVVQQCQGREEDADSFLRDALAMHQATGQAPSPDFAAAFHSVANLRRQQGHLHAAEWPCRTALDILQGLYDQDHPAVVEATRDLADLRRLLAEAVAAASAPTE